MCTLSSTLSLSTFGLRRSDFPTECPSDKLTRAQFHQINTHPDRLYCLQINKPFSSTSAPSFTFVQTLLRYRSCSNKRNKHFCPLVGLPHLKLELFKSRDRTKTETKIFVTAIQGKHVAVNFINLFPAKRETTEKVHGWSDGGGWKQMICCDDP